MSSDSLLYLILAILLAEWLWDQWLEWLNLRRFRQGIPAELQDSWTEPQFERAYAYHRTNYRFSLLQGAISLALTFAVLSSGALGLLDSWLRGFTEHPVGLPLLFFALLYLGSDLLSWPFQWYRTFHIEARFDFNQTTPATFWSDKAKSYLLAALLGGPVLGLLIWLIHGLGPAFWWWFWLFFSLFLLLVQVFYTSLLLPLFNKLTPLEEGSLRTAIERYAEKVSFPLTHILVMDGSLRSSKANAFFSGLGRRKKVVLFDTLIEQNEEEELVAVLAHEVGHYKKHHVIQGYVLGVLQAGLMLFLLSWFVESPALTAALGGSQPAIHLNLLAFGLLYSPISTILGLLMNLRSRRHEFEADRYAAETYRAAPLGTALRRLHTDHLGHPSPHPLYVFFHYSHPPMQQRLKALEALG